jgi:ATP-dependent RNA helicase RhlE
VTTSFLQLALVAPLQRALRAENYDRPTPIQAQAIPHLLAGRDLLGIAQTGTGKTAAFALPILQSLSAKPGSGQRGTMRALILTPTRELAIQIGDSFRTYGRYLVLRSAVIFGGVGQQPQVDALARGLDILVATPGRLLDLTAQGHVRFDRLSIFVLDEADRMLDMGFIHDVRRVIAALPKERQSLLFSATMPPAIDRLAQNILKDSVRVEATPVASTAERIDQRVLFVPTASKRALLAETLKDAAITRALVFTRTKHGANRVAAQLDHIGVCAEAIHGNKSQSARQRALANFRSGRTRVLVATDIAARGIDIDGISHVINYELPNVPESYVHRIGRTARARNEGSAISFCDDAERPLLKDIEKLTRRPLKVVELPALAHPPEKSSAPASRHAASPTATGSRELHRRKPDWRRRRSRRNGAERPSHRQVQAPACLA